MAQTRTFLDLVLDEEGLHTPDGILGISRITGAEVVRHRSGDAGVGGGGGGSYASHAGGVGGALLGGAVAGPIGFIGGGLLGSAIDREDSDETSVPRTVSATVTFDSPDLVYTTMVDRERVEDAEAFVAAVKKAAGLGR